VQKFKHPDRFGVPHVKLGQGPVLDGVQAGVQYPRDIGGY
jgi:hypothetical protein